MGHLPIKLWLPLAFTCGAVVGWATGLIVDVGNGFVVGAIEGLGEATDVGLGASAVKVEVGLNSVAVAGAVAATAVALGSNVEMAGAGKSFVGVGSNKFTEALQANVRDRVIKFKKGLMYTNLIVL